MAFTTTLIISCKRMVVIFIGQFLAICQTCDDFVQFSLIKITFLASFKSLRNRLVTSISYIFDKF